MTNKPNWLKNSCGYDADISEVGYEYIGEYFRVET